jgi:nicotinamidase-related amidase
MATQIAALKRRAKHAGIPAIYVNDNFGRWQSDFAKLLAHCLEDGVQGQPLAEQLRPEGDDYFVLKPKHSGFYATTLDLFLRYLKVTTVILTGLTCQIPTIFILEAVGVCWGAERLQQPQEQPLDKGVGHE